MKKIYIYLLLLMMQAFVTNCGYTPIYSTSNFDLKFNKFDYDPNALNKQIVQTLSSLSNNTGSKEYDVKITTLKEKNIVSKNSKGETIIFEKKIILQLEVYNNKNKHSKKFYSKINYNNNDNKFELNQYEIEIEKQIIDDLVEKVIIFFSNL